MSLQSVHWRKSSYSTSSGGNCIELARLSWRKSTRSGENGGNCVELAGLSWRKSNHSGSDGGDCAELADAAGRWWTWPVLLVTHAALRDAVNFAHATR
ncbi:hypothetical protein amrb99_18580 [Actinomadura sp. RB99]|uniref:DUF397 domain-containing protein n=1 Tax=Actinomadura sp. RB99 TaxID=2691577 RepID=UPI001689BD39|nr:DUF397 domain-containing protein [Actinomadura sp. RB99]MBD2892938.1 hypothetical protein [Actinomadura sp. RB99]